MKRSNTEQKIDVLRVLRENGELKPTHILYKTNLSSERKNEIIDVLVQNGLVEEVKGNYNRKWHPENERMTYKITQTGINILNSYEIIIKELGDHKHEAVAFYGFKDETNSKRRKYIW